MTNNPNDSFWNKAWISGAAGALTVTLIALWFEKSNVLRTGIELFGVSLTETRQHSILFALLASASVVFLIELYRQKKLSNQDFFHKPLHKGINFYADCVVFYIQTIVLLIAIKMFYQTANEYGYTSRSSFYKPWFLCLELFIQYFYILGLPYIIFTRSLRHNEEADKSRYGSLVGKISMLILSKLPPLKDHKPEFNTKDRQIFLSLLLKMFFLPLVIVFFFKIFPQLIQSLSYVSNGLPNSFSNNTFQHATFNKDLAHIAVSILFTIQLVVLFSCYSLTSRWINSKQIMDESLFSWACCIIVFPPFIHMLITSWVDAMIGPMLQEPSRVILQISNQSIVSACILMMIGFYTLYVASTLNLGLSYANLCYRNLVQSGLYSIVRHPAYCTKMLGISCFTLPLIILNASDSNWEHAGSLTGGLLVGYILFIARAIREERLLNQTCDYQAYKQKVPYRFIPKIF